MSLILRGTDFGPVQCASGAMGWFGEGYWFHRWIPGLDWAGCTFVSKTTTLSRRQGNMPFWDTEIINKQKHKFRPKERFPRCVAVYPLKGAVINSVGLSGPGSLDLFETGRWQDRDDPFFISFMSVAESLEQRKKEALEFIKQVDRFEMEFCAPFGVQINLSCPNTGHDPGEIASEAKEFLGLFQTLREDSNIPIVPKFNVLYPAEAVREIERLCDAVCVSNTIPWGKLPDRIDWRKYSVCPYADPPVSPLHHLGGGGLSGKPLLRLVEEWVRQARGRDLSLPVIAGGGILAPKDVDVLARAGADAVFLGSIAILRGWRVRRTIRRARDLLGG